MHLALESINEEIRKICQQLEWDSFLGENDRVKMIEKLHTLLEIKEQYYELVNKKD